MAVPKRKMSRSNTRSRRAQWKTTVVPTVITCSTLHARAVASTAPRRLAARSSRPEFRVFRIPLRG